MAVSEQCPEPCTVLLIGNYRDDRQQSMLRFENVIEQELKARYIHVETLAPSALFGRLKPSPVGVGKWLGYVDKFVFFPFVMKQRIGRMPPSKASRCGSIVHICDHSNAIYTRYLRLVPHLVTCHDVLAIRSAAGEISQNPTRWPGRQLQRFIRNGLMQARWVACVSEATRLGLLRTCNVSPKVTKVIYMGLNYPYNPMGPLVAWDLLNRLFSKRKAGRNKSTVFNYLLHVGGNQWYKNRLGVLNIYIALKESWKSEDGGFPELVLVGPPLTQEMKALLLNQPKLCEMVTFVEGVGNEELRALYSCAEMLVFPSLDEGFGWPIIEAQACGCRVVATRHAPMTEVGGSAAVYLDCSMVDGTTSGGFAKAADLLRAILREQEGAKQERVSRGLNNACKFSTERMIEQYVDLYAMLIKGGKVGGYAPPSNEPRRECGYCM